ncbi:MAG: hypothetical protein Q8O40_10565 [Chloroflexota bacterium]|nr:hypothetical protein [Chloroflexota bacterium]
MTAPEVRKPPDVGGVVRQGLGFFGQGIGTVAEALRSVDAALQQVDGALTGSRAPVTPMVSEEYLARRVATVLQQAEQAAKTAGLAAPATTSRFAEALRLARTPLPPTPAVADMMPTPPEMVRMALRDLRGSTALMRLASGAGTTDDLEEVGRFATDLSDRMGTVQAATAQQGAPAARPAQPRQEGPPAPERKPRRRSPRAAPAAPAGKPSTGVLLAQAIGEEMGDARVKKWADQVAQGKLTEKQFLSRLERLKSNVDPDQLFKRARDRVVAMGVSPDDPLLKGLDEAE